MILTNNGLVCTLPLIPLYSTNNLQNHFTAILPLLKNLKQLHLKQRRTPNRGAPSFPAPQSGPHGEKSSIEIALEYAKKILKLCPSLQYIGIGYRPAWHIQYHAPVDKLDTGLRFIPLSEEDLDDPKIFAIDHLGGQSGLLCPRYDSTSSKYRDWELARVEIPVWMGNLRREVFEGIIGRNLDTLET